MRLLSCLLASATLAVCALPASVDAQVGPAYEVFPLHEQNGSGESGAIVLTPIGPKTKVEVVVANEPPGIPQPTHVHVGPCAKLVPTPTYVLTSTLDGLSVTILDVPMTKLTDGTFAVNVHESPTQISHYVACGDLIPPK
ncbi:MAG TPA: hypothetical protein VME66_09820 [Candidatus Acidoferrales bacterium]|nr:hypothetical protein [Candidatus Acidoferrales bacterium]